MTTTSDLYLTSLKLLHAEAEGWFSLSVFGDALGAKHGRALGGMEAIRYHLAQKHNWLPHQVQSLQLEELTMLLTDEMRDWTWPKEALDAQRRWKALPE